VTIQLLTDGPATCQIGIKPNYMSTTEVACKWKT